jgi:hypothetical protein
VRQRTESPLELTVSDLAGFDLPEDDAATIFDLYNEALSNVASFARSSARSRISTS